MSGAYVVEPGFRLADVVSTIRATAGETTAFVVSDDDGALASAKVSAPDRVVVLDGLSGEATAETIAPALAEACRRRQVELLVLPATTRWREVAAQLAMHLGAACVADALSVTRAEDGALRAERLLYGGLAIATVVLQRSPAIVTMAYPAGDATPADAASVPVEREKAGAPSSVKVLLERTEVEQAAALDMAGRIVAVGRGLRSRDDLALIEALALELGAELACSRPLAEDLRWLPPERQVGLTGSTVKPELYVAVGISGQIQHLVGMRDAGLIVAINTNASAPIFGVVDVGVVGDLYKVVPRLTAALAARRPTG